ncbi:hypothetical protein A2875_04180 [Candidatus Gottesmanbacteria bacterium RIFCSPHIGHO2_01_FULL_46_14]|uniref:Mannosyl-glycoprotein endo-beta-N-acetylglucosamidase-like domain-containing protein n=3 Tax=Microgenomates group TaxID=1794810 RepID=A0A1F5ZSI8_9BACT|nr:MAG: hypothetical protein UU34_C0014G0016 [Candidatus Curtissbacteria bacterium GW2011_GWA1_41_11]OGG15456.1 MAG: hypothetical protein A2875_04180 [Candidatus Gottesmanbacteria bacterium RIFCSPHIGHO2_01_FULL_46_14]OGG30209.1 MAG: hypothetical protein A2971_04125 [Candidatus Gottesmanbacteria bacterium RIFCSPLOWO2_01_FULL_46_21]HCR81423.1 hypothetical protein [Candidatus Paceibacterota bacterium]
MVRKLLLVFLWFPVAVIFLGINLTILAASLNADPKVPPLSVVPTYSDDFQITTSRGTAQVLGATVTAADARALLLESFLRQHDSPMTPYADRIVAKADENGIDFRLVVAIAMCESNLGKRMPTRNSHNAWGISVYSGEQDGANFRDWTFAIDWVSKYIKEKYYDRGLVSLKDIGAVWAPPSVENGNSWMNCVESFQSSIL